MNDLTEKTPDNNSGGYIPPKEFHDLIMKHKEEAENNMRIENGQDARILGLNKENA